MSLIVPQFTTHVPHHPTRKLGWKGKQFYTHADFHFSALKLLAPQSLIKPVASTAFTTGFPPEKWGVILNDKYGCCVFSAKAHRDQAVNFAMHGITAVYDGTVYEPYVMKLYERFGFDPMADVDPITGENVTDKGAFMQPVADSLTAVGWDTPEGKRDFKYTIEVDPRNLTDFDYLLDTCNGIDIGQVLPSTVMPEDGSMPPRVWEKPTGSFKWLGAHDTMIVDKLTNGNYKIISWGTEYEGTPGYVQSCVQTALGYVAPDLLNTQGKTLLGFSIDQLHDLWNGVPAASLV